MTMPGFGPAGPLDGLLQRLRLLSGGMQSAGTMPPQQAQPQGGTPPQPPPGGAQAPQQPPQSWGEKFASRLLGPEGSSLPANYQRDALITGLLTGAAALGQPGGAKYNWGNALLQGVAGVRAGTQEGSERVRLDRYRKSIEEQIAQTTDPLERERLEFMLYNPERYVEPPTPVQGRAPELKAVTDPSDPTGRRWSWFHVFEDGTSRRLFPWSVRPKPAGGGRDDRPTPDQLRMSLRAIQVRQELRRIKDPDERMTYLLDHPGAEGIARQPTWWETTKDPAAYYREMDELFGPGNTPEEPPEEPGWIDSIGDTQDEFGAMPDHARSEWTGQPSPDAFDEMTLGIEPPVKVPRSRPERPALDLEDALRQQHIRKR